MNLDDFLAKVEKLKAKEGVNYRPPYPDMRMNPDHPDHVRFMAQYMGSMELPQESNEAKIRKLALNDPILHAVLTMARSNGLNRLDTLEVMVLTLQSTLAASQSKVVADATIKALPDDAEYDAMLHYVTSDADGNLEANDAIGIADLKALQAEVEGYRTLIADAITIRLDIKGRFDVMSGTYPDSGLKYWLETRNNTVHNTVLEAYAALTGNTER